MIGRLSLLTVAIALVAVSLTEAAAARPCKCPEVTAYRPPSHDTTPRQTSEEFRDQLASAQAGNVIAMRIVGLRYAQAMGVSLDYRRAFFWLLKASRRGDAIARNTVAEVGRRLTYRERVLARRGQFPE